MSHGQSSPEFGPVDHRHVTMLPEFMQQLTIKDIPPNFPYYFGASILTYDQTSGGLYVRSDTKIRRENEMLTTRDTSRMGKIALMQVLDPLTPEAATRLIVDASTAMPGQITLSNNLFPADESWREEMSRDLVRVSAAVFHDPDDAKNTFEYRGDQSLFVELDALREAYDAALSALDKE